MWQVKHDMLQGGADLGYAKLEQENPWLMSTQLVVKPDQLIKRRGKAGLLAVNKTWPEVKEWISERMGKIQKVRPARHVLIFFEERHGLPYTLCCQPCCRVFQTLLHYCMHMRG